MKALVRSLSCVYGDRCDHEDKWDIFKKYVNSRDQEMYCFPERVWIEREYMDIVHEINDRKTWDVKAQDAKLAYKRLYKALAQLFGELLTFPGDGQRVSAILARFKQFAEESKRNNKDERLTIRDLLEYTKVLVDEVSQSEASYFNVYRRDAIRRRRVFSMTAVELWSESNFELTRDARKVFMGDKFEDPPEELKMRKEKLTEAAPHGPSRYLYDTVEVQRQAGQRWIDNTFRDPELGPSSGARVLRRMRTADPVAILYKIFEKPSEKLGKELASVIQKPRDVLDVKPCSFKVPVGKEEYNGDQEPLLDEFWGDPLPRRKANETEVKSKLLRNEEKGDSVFIKTLSEPRAQEIAQRFILSSIPDKYLDALVLLLRVGVSANSAARIMNSVPRGLAALQMETYIRRICTEALTTQENAHEGSSQRVQLHVASVMPFNVWAPQERVRLLALCAALKGMHDDEAEEQAKQNEELKAEMDKEADLLKAKYAEQMKAALQNGRDLVSQKQDALHLIRSLDPDYQTIEFVDPDPSLEELQAEVENRIEFMKDDLTQNHKKLEKNYRKLLQEVEKLKTLIHENEQNVSNIKKRSQKDLDAISKKTARLELSKTKDLIEMYGISPEIGIFVEKCIQMVLPGKNTDLVECAEKLMQMHPPFHELFMKGFENNSLESCVFEFYESRAALVTELQGALEGSLEQARLAREMKRLDNIIHVKEKKGAGMGVHVTIEDWRKTRDSNMKIKEQLLANQRVEEANTIQKNIDIMENAWRSIDILWFNSFVTDTPVGTLGDAQATEGLVARVVSETKLECLLMRKSWLAFKHIVQARIKMHCPPPPSDQEDLQGMGDMQLTDQERNLVDGLLLKCWSKYNSASEQIQGASAKYFEKQALVGDREQGLKLFSQGLFREAWALICNGDDDRKVKIPLNDQYFTAKDIEKAGMLFKDNAAGRDIISGLNRVISQLWEELTPDTRREAMRPGDKVWNDMYARVMRNYGFTPDARRIESMLQKIWTLELLGESLPKTGDEDEEGGQPVRRSSRSKKQTNVSESFRKITSVAQMASDLVLSMKSKGNILRQYWKIARILDGGAGSSGSGTTAEADEIDMLSAVRSVGAWVKRIHSDLVRDKISAKRFAHDPDNDARRILEDAKGLIVERYRIQDFKRRNWGEELAGPDYYSGDEQLEVQDGLTEEDKNNLVNLFEADFQATCADETGREIFHDQDSTELKKVRFLYVRLPSAIQKFQPDLHNRMKVLLESVDRQYEELELFDHLDVELSHMDAKTGRYENLLSEKARIFRKKKADDGHDYWIERMSAFISEMREREEVYSTPDTDKEHQQRVDKFPYDPATDRELVALAQRLLSQYQGMIRKTTDQADMVRYLFEKMTGPERNLEDAFLRFFRDFNQGLYASGDDIMENIGRFVEEMTEKRNAALDRYSYDNYNPLVELSKLLLDQYKQTDVQNELQKCEEMDYFNAEKEMLRVLFCAAKQPLEKIDLLGEITEAIKKEERHESSKSAELRQRLRKFVDEMENKRFSVAGLYDFREMDTWLSIANQLVEQHAAMMKRFEAMEAAARGLGREGNNPFHARNYSFEVTTQQIRAQVAKDILQQITELEEQLAEFRAEKEEIRRIAQKGDGEDSGGEDDEEDNETAASDEEGDVRMRDADQGEDMQLEKKKKEPKGGAAAKDRKQKHAETESPKKKKRVEEKNEPRPKAGGKTRSSKK